MKANAQDLARLERAFEGMVNTANDSSREGGFAPANGYLDSSHDV